MGVDLHQVMRLPTRYIIGCRRNTISAIVSAGGPSCQSGVWHGTGLGNGQIWQYPARSAGVTYVNATGRPIFVSVNALNNPPGSMLVVDGVAVGFNWIGGAPGAYGQLYGVVPPGSSYYVTSPLIQWWAELR